MYFVRAAGARLGKCPLSDYRERPAVFPRASAARPYVVGAKSAKLRFPRLGKPPPAPLLLLYKPDPLSLGSGLVFGYPYGISIDGASVGATCGRPHGLLPTIELRRASTARPYGRKPDGASVGATCGRPWACKARPYSSRRFQGARHRRRLRQGQGRLHPGQP